MTLETKEQLSAKAAGQSKKAFFEQLEKADVSAIQALALKVAPDVKRLIKRAGLAQEDVEEVLNDAILTTLQSIRKGTFQFMGFHPEAYTLGVAKKLIANQVRSKKPKTELLENMEAPSDFTPENYLKNKERVSIVKELLGRMDENCRQLLLLRFFDNKRDKEAVEEKLTPYTTVGSLKSKREQCLKRLAETAKQAGIKQAF